MKPHRPSVILDQDVQLPRRAHLRVVRDSAPPPPLALPEVRRARTGAVLREAAIAVSLIAGVVLVLAALHLL